MNPSPSMSLGCFVLSFLMLLSLGQPVAAQVEDYSGAPIFYNDAKVNDPVARLDRKLKSGEAKLDYDSEQGYLKSLLDALDIPVSSQTLVFSKTSLQLDRISPHRPRAIYFNDDVYVGYCQHGDVLEIAATDAKQGATFYTLEQVANGAPEFIRDQGQCLSCHSSNRTQDVPGYLVRSVFANAKGMPEFGSGTFNSDHTSPFAERWGGWYVTGTHGDMRHMGNAIFDKETETLDQETHANAKTLEGLVSTKPYPSAHSDIVALMVLQHQTQMHNAITWANYETRRAVHYSEVMNKLLERPEGELGESADRRINRAAERVLKYLLLCDEFELTSPVKGTSTFAEDFSARGVKDSQGRSLRDLDLTKRMFRYPCSYLIYAKSFDGLPDLVRERVLVQLKQILDGNMDAEQAKRFAHLSDADRENVKQILLETKPEFAALYASDK